jgi:hypothetical protein
LLATRVTVLVPCEEYVTLPGLCCAEVAGLAEPLVSKTQLHEVGEPEDWSVNCTAVPG